MGTYLTTGIVQKIMINKPEIRNSKLTIEDFTQALQKEDNLEHYIYGENEEEFF